MKKFEYKTTACDFADLNSLGGEGWELCAIKGLYPNAVYIFKREKIENKSRMSFEEPKNPNKKFREGDWIRYKKEIGKNAYRICEVCDNGVHITYESNRHFKLWGFDEIEKIPRNKLGHYKKIY